MLPPTGLRDFRPPCLDAFRARRRGSARHLSRRARFVPVRQRVVVARADAPGQSWNDDKRKSFEPVSRAPAATAVLDFEKPLVELDRRIHEVRICVESAFYITLPNGAHVGHAARAGASERERIDRNACRLLVFSSCSALGSSCASGWGWCLMCIACSLRSAPVWPLCRPRLQACLRSDVGGVCVSLLAKQHLLWCSLATIVRSVLSQCGTTAKRRPAMLACRRLQAVLRACSGCAIIAERMQPAGLRLCIPHASCIACQIVCCQVCMTRCDTQHRLG